MSTFTKRSTVYFDPAIHRALRLKVAETERSISDLVNDAVKAVLAEDAEDLTAFDERAPEPTEDPRPHGCEKLRGQDRYRVR